MELRKADLLILDALCLDYPVMEIHGKLGLSRTYVNKRLIACRQMFNVQTNTGLVFKYALLHEIKTN